MAGCGGSTPACEVFICQCRTRIGEQAGLGRVADPSPVERDTLGLTAIPAYEEGIPPRAWARNRHGFLAINGLAGVLQFKSVAA